MTVSMHWEQKIVNSALKYIKIVFEWKAKREFRSLAVHGKKLVWQESPLHLGTSAAYWSKLSEIELILHSSADNWISFVFKAIKMLPRWQLKDNSLVLVALNDTSNFSAHSIQPKSSSSSTVISSLSKKSSLKTIMGLWPIKEGELKTYLL